MEIHYYNSADRAQFGNITEWQSAMGRKFFHCYGEVFKAGARSEREKSLLA